MAYSADGQQVVTASYDGTARRYFTRTEDMIAYARTRVGRELTCQERVQYVHEVLECK